MPSYQKLIENAVEWAYSILGSQRYKFLCLAFVEDAYEISNSIEIFGGSCARESADIYNVNRVEGIPPKGSFVFYDCYGNIGGVYKNWGHVGLAMDGGNVIHAWDKVRVDNYLDIQNSKTAPGWSNPKYLGFSTADCILRGYKNKNPEEIK